MRPLTRAAASAALCVCALSTSGCLVAAVAAGAAVAYGAVKYTENEAYGDFRSDLDDTWEATLAALNENGYPVGRDLPHGATGGEIKTGDAKVIVEAHPSAYTRVRVRIGTFDNEDHRRRARLILESVGRRID